MLYMDNMFSILIAAIVMVVFAILLSFIIGIKSRLGKNNQKTKSRQAILREANKKLASNPHNVQALKEIGDLYYKEHNWQKAAPMYDTLVNLSSAHHEINIAETTLRQGICDINLNKTKEALKALAEARRLAPDNFEANFYLGKTCIMQDEYIKAIPFLKKAISINPEVSDCYALVGKAYYLSKKYRDSLPYLKRALNHNPENKELLFSMADALSESGSSEKAMKVFMHLRPDPDYGAKSCLEAGIYHANSGKLEEAIKDFEIGLRHQNIPPELTVNIKYRLAQCYIKANNIPAGISLLKDIQLTSPSYKDVDVLVQKYQELVQNSNLRTYLTGTSSEFVALCRKITTVFFKNSRVKVADINVTAEYAELFTEIDTDKWQDSIIFRFYRTTGATGDLYIREFHGKIRDEKVGRGICFTAGSYTDEAKKYIEGRPIDLIEKNQLIKILSSVSASQFDF